MNTILVNIKIKNQGMLEMGGGLYKLSNARFLSLRTTGILDWIIVCGSGVGSPVNRRMFTRVLNLHPLNVSSKILPPPPPTPSAQVPAGTIKMSLYCQVLKITFS